MEMGAERESRLHQVVCYRIGGEAGWFKGEKGKMKIYS